jgi:hypothetical protein
MQADQRRRTDLPIEDGTVVQLIGRKRLASLLARIIPGHSHQDSAPSAGLPQSLERATVRAPPAGLGFGEPGEEDAIPATIDGRSVISRADMQALHGISVKSAYLWYRDREATGYPEPAGVIGRTTYWYEDEWLDWYQSYRDRKRHGLTQVDRGGDPDDLVDAAEAARIMGYSGRDVIHANLRLGYFPRPDGYETTAKGRPSPRWRRSAVWAAADDRQSSGGGRRAGTSSSPAG